ncbi:MAG: imidazolonepropionase [Gemmatimonadota bacterium]|nr:imidazolonepropionase [Gemmatimonadota bacterium]
MPVLRSIGLLARCLPDGGQGEIHAVAAAAMAWDDGVVRWVGSEAELPAEYRDWPAEDARGRLVIPGLVDCHTHLAFGGWRGDEFAERLAGRDYLEIAAAGGGIAATVARTRRLSVPMLVERCRGHLREMERLGVTTVEAKSGYGLSFESELALLEVYAELARTDPVRIVATLLGAHVVPPEFKARRDEYLAMLVDRLIPEVGRRGLASFCDVFVEETAFPVDEARRILEAGKAAGLRSKLHADQLTAGGGAELAAEVGAISADHLECISPAGIAAMAAAGVVAVSLPIATLYLNQRPLPARALMEAGVPVAVATDFNPGSAPSYHLPLAMMLACTMQRMTPREVLRGATAIAAQAIGLGGEAGSLAPGLAADFAIIDAPDPEFWMYHFRANACLRTVRRGETLWRAPEF